MTRGYPSLAGLCLYLIFAGLWMYAPGTYRTLLYALDGMPLANAPFSDFSAILQAGACWRAGADVYAPNACMGGGVYNYSPFLLPLLDLPIGPWGGLTLDLVFLAALAGLPPARSAAELGVRVAAVCSGVVIFALERANLDVAIFLLVLLSVYLLLARRWAALAGYALFALAAAAKFYPVVLLGLLIRERLALLLGGLLCLLVAAILYVLLFAHGTAAALRILPKGLPFSGNFSASNLCFGLVLLRYMPVLTLTPNAPQYLAAVQHAHAVSSIVLGSKILTILAFVAAVRGSAAYASALPRLGAAESLLLAAGALVMLGCFVLVQNIPYRAIFLLLTLPGLWGLGERAGPALRGRMFLLCGVVIFLMWEAAFGNLVQALAAGSVYPSIAFWLLRELCWWWVMIQFCAICLCFLRESLAARRGEAVAWRG